MHAQEAWARCLSDLQASVRHLQVRHDGLKAENAALRQKLQALMTVDSGSPTTTVWSLGDDTTAANGKRMVNASSFDSSNLANTDKMSVHSCDSREETCEDKPPPAKLRVLLKSQSEISKNGTPKADGCLKPPVELPSPGHSCKGWDKSGSRSQFEADAECADQSNSQADWAAVGIGNARLEKLHLDSSSEIENDSEDSEQDYVWKMVQGFLNHTFRDLEDLLGEEFETRNVVERVVHSNFFRFLFIVAIVANAIHIGMSTDTNVKSSYSTIQGASLPSADRTVDIIFFVWFTFEFLLRFVSERKKFLAGNDKWFNLLDAFALLNSAVEFTFELNANLSYLRIFRVFRLVRFVRVVRNVRVLRSLRSLVFAILHTFVDLVWSLMVIMFMIFAFAIVFTSAADSFFQNVNVNDSSQIEVARQVRMHFGGVYTSMISLFAAITGGEDWMKYGHTLRAFPDGEASASSGC
eukprot:TRINITY_DN46961_c0_g1_i4.p1 TRINITY_DN46961_c0_g1~~TRINITY_DN46961_c0_g1_i4.p1  ORF type:complete len:467 (-),score=91.27 TRINITY_DN46961_c0_g1_i4:871-2271(-)